MAESKLFTIGIIGGTGKEGKGLAYRWAKYGHQIKLGSRQLQKAQNAVDEIHKIDPSLLGISPSLNDEAIRDSDFIVLTVPFSAHIDMLKLIKPLIKNKILIDVSVPLVPPKVTKVHMPPAGSAGLEAKSILGDEAKICTAFQNISYENLLYGKPMECDVLVCGTDKESRSYVITLVKDAGLVGWDAGPLENSVVVEGLTSILIGINIKYNIENAGIKITGL